jgi:hypothetical protein
MELLITIGTEGRFFLVVALAALVSVGWTNICAYFGWLGPECRVDQQSASDSRAD